MTYIKPSVTVDITSERVAPALIPGDETLMIIGESGIYPEANTEQMVIAGAEVNNLAKEGIDGSITVVLRDDPTTPLVADTDYVLPDATNNNGLIVSSISKKFTAITNEIIGPFAAAGATFDLDQGNVRPGTVNVTNLADSINYTEGTDYWVDYKTGRVTHIEGGAITPHASTTYHVDYNWATIADDDILLVSYNWTPSDLYEIHEWSNINDMIAYYGPGMVGDTVYSSISLAATLMAREVSGANLPTIKTLAINPDEATSGDEEVVDVDDYVASLENKIALHTDITHIGVLKSETQIWGSIASFAANQASSTGERNYMRTFLAPDDGFGILSRATGSTSILGLGSKRVQVYSPEVVPWTNPATGNEILLPGYYLSIVAMGKEAISRREISQTRKVFNVFNAFKYPQLLTENQKDRMAASGITVIENGPGGNLIIRDSLTTSLANPEDQEPSIVRTLDYLARDFKAAFNNALAEGEYFSDDVTALTFQTASEQRLTSHVREGTIESWSTITVEPGNDIRRFTIRGRIIPRYPLKGVDFKFSIP